MTGQKAPTALGTEKIGKLLMQYAVPAIIAMTASSLYNMVDSIFIGHGVCTMAISLFSGRKGTHFPASKQNYSKREQNYCGSKMNTYEARQRVLKSRFRDDFTKIEYDFHTSGKDWKTTDAICSAGNYRHDGIFLI